MAKEENRKTAEQRITDLEKKVQELSERTGGMLSSKDFERLVIIKKEENKKDFQDQKEAFFERKWEEVGRRFIIDPYDGLNLTPFSYDLSIGDEIFSVQKKDRMRKRLPYDIVPRETVIILTREFIALPPCYSATIWPRFNLVREGIFQSMVKIDPTWYGHLGVAVTNFSPRTITLEEDMAFGTLVLYELCNETDIDLWQPDRLPSVRVKIPDSSMREKLRRKLDELELTNTCWVEGEEIVVMGLKKTSYKKLCMVDSSKPWQNIAKEVKKKWLEYKDPTTKRKYIGMEALEMENLEKLVQGSPMGKGICSEDVKKATITQDALLEAAVEYGKPFDLMAAIPESILDRTEKEVIPHVEAQVGARLFPQMVQLTIRIIALLSLVGVMVALAGQYFDKGTTLIGILALIVIPIMFFVLVSTLRTFSTSELSAEVKKKEPLVKCIDVVVKSVRCFTKLIGVLYDLLVGAMKKLKDKLSSCIKRKKKND